MNPILEFAGDAQFGAMLGEHKSKVGYAYRNSVNNTVFEIQKYARDHFDDNFTERNSFSKRGIVFDKARTPVIEDVEAATGALKNRPWMAKQEKGFTTSSAQAGEQSRVSGSYKRAVRKKNYIQNASIRRRMDVQSKANTIRGKAKAMLAISYRNGYGLKGSSDFFRFSAGELFPNMAEGLYQFGSGSVMGDLGYPQIHLAYRLDNKRRIKPTPWLEEAVQAKGQPKDILRRFEQQMKQQIKRFK